MMSLPPYPASVGVVVNKYDHDRPLTAFTKCDASLITV